MSIAAIAVGDVCVTVNACWDADAEVWIATGRSIEGLVVEAGTWPELIEEIQLIVPDLLEVRAAIKTRSQDAS